MIYTSIRGLYTTLFGGNMKKFSLILVVLLFGPGGISSSAAENPQVLMKTELGDMVLEIYMEKAPVTAANFLKYVDEGRWEGAHFYRVVTMDNQPDNEIKIEVIQGGLGSQRSDLRLPPIAHETTEQTGILHKDGAVSMARSEPGTASSEFFICVNDQPELNFGGRRNPDGQGFAAFGQVIRGMDVVKKIQMLPSEKQTLTTPVKILSVTRKD